MLGLDKPSQQKLFKGEIEPWRCKHCNKLIYNRDENGYPVPGAPVPRWWSLEFNKVCNFCYDVALAAKEKVEE